MNLPMSTNPEDLLQGQRTAFRASVSIYNLSDSYRCLPDTLAQHGVQAAQIPNLLRGAVALRCSQCGTVVDGSELVNALLSEPPCPNRAGTMRLRRGYCVTPGCPSLYVELVFGACEAVDWSTVWAHAQSAGKPNEETAQLARSGEFARWWQTSQGRKVGIGMVAGVIAIFWIYWMIRAPAWSRPNPAYRAEPASSFQSPITANGTP